MKKIVLAFLIVCLLVIGGYFLINEGLLKQQEPVKEARTKPVEVKQKPKKPSRVKPVEVNRETATPSRYDQYLAVKRKRQAIIRKWENDWEEKGYKVLSVAESEVWLMSNQPNFKLFPRPLGKNATVVTRIPGTDGMIIHDPNRKRRILLPTTFTDPAQNGAPANELTQEEIAMANKIKTWLKKEKYTVSLGFIYDPNGSRLTDVKGGRAGNNKVRISDLGYDRNIRAHKYRISITGVGSAYFILDANDELQPTK